MIEMEDTARAVSLQLIGVGTRHCRVLIVGNINSDATGFDITEYPDSRLLEEIGNLHKFNGLKTHPDRYQIPGVAELRTPIELLLLRP